MHHRTVNGLVLLYAFYITLFSEVKNLKEPILASSVSQLVMLSEPNSSDVALEVPIEGFLNDVCPVKIVDFHGVGHTDDEFDFVFGDFDAVGDEAEFLKFDFFVGVVGAGAGIPELDGSIVGATGEFETHYKYDFRGGVEGSIL